MASSKIKQPRLSTYEIMAPTNTINTSVTVSKDEYCGFLFSMCNNTGKVVYATGVILSNMIMNDQITRTNIYSGASDEVDFTISHSGSQITITLVAAAASGDYGRVFGLAVQ